MLRHIGIKFEDKPDKDNYGPHDVIFRDLDTDTILGDGWVKLDKTWLISVQFVNDDPDSERANIALVCNSNADKSKCPIIITSDFGLTHLDVVVILNTSTDSWDYCFLKRDLWDQLSAMGVTELKVLNPSQDTHTYMAVECVSNGTVVNPITKVRGFTQVDRIEEQNPFAEIHARTTLYKETDGDWFDGDKIKVPYILQKTTSGLVALFPQLKYIGRPGTANQYTFDY